MADKLRKTFPLRITFSDGENPTAAKLNAISTQTRNGLDIVERAVGDVWNQSGDTLLSSIPLQLPNLARMVGQNSYLNPVIYPLEQDFFYKENLGSKWAGKVHGYLTFKPKTSSAFTSTDAQFANEVASEYLVGRGTNQAFWVSDDTGEFRVNHELTAAGAETLTYKVSPSADWLNGSEVFPGVIPDIRQDTFTGCRLEYDVGTGKYFLHLPPRQPLDFDQATFDRPEAEVAKYPHSDEVAESYNFATALPPGEEYKYWQSSAVNALEDQHYRYSLPKELRDATIAAGGEYPSGFLFLWDRTSDTLIDGLIFKKPSTKYLTQPWILEVESATTDLSVYVCTPNDESEAAYSDKELVLITCGAPLSRVLWTTLTAFLRHDHAGDHTSTIDHGSLKNLDPPVATGNEHVSRYPTTLPRWTGSAWNQDDHVSYLSRGGSQTVSGLWRDKHNNAMLGHLLMANADTDGESFLNPLSPDGTYGIFFGDTVGGYKVSQNSSGQLLVNGGPGMSVTVSGTNIDALTATGNGTSAGLYGIGGSTNGNGVKGLGVGTGYGIQGRGGSSNGTGVVGLGDARSSPTIGLGDFGVYGEGNATTASGVYGYTSGAGVGVYGYAPAAGGQGVWGNAETYGLYGVRGSSGGANIAIYGNSVDGIAVQGESSRNNGVYGRHTGTDITKYGGYFNSTATDGNGVRGDGSGIGTGVYGVAASNASGRGVYGYHPTTGQGVYGSSAGAGTGVAGYSAAGGTSILGVAGTSDSSTGGKFYGGEPNGVGVKAYGNGSGNAIEGYGDGTGVGGYFEGGSSGAGSAGVSGLGKHANPGGYFQSGSSAGANGIEGEASTGAGVKGTATDSTGYGVYGYNIAGGIGVKGYSAYGNAGVYGISAGSYGIVAEGDTTSPAKAAFRIVPQDTNPSSSPQYGDIYVTAIGILMIYVSNTGGGSPGWMRVADQYSPH